MRAKQPSPGFQNLTHGFAAGWSSPVARQAHNLKVVGSNPAPATKSKKPSSQEGGFFVGCSCEKSFLSGAPPIAEIEHPRQASRGHDGALDVRQLFRHRLLERQLGRENAQQRVKARLDRRAGRAVATAERRALRATLHQEAGGLA